MMFKVALCSLLLVSAQAQTLGTGPCPDLGIVQDFDVAAYLGTWYQIARTQNPFEKGNCSKAIYGPIEDGLVKVHNVEIRNGEESSIDGTAELANPNSTEAKLIVKFFNPDSVADYEVVATDYEHYSLVWSCSNVGNLFHIYFSWILSREKPLTADAQQAIDNLLTRDVLKDIVYQVHDTEECAVQPVPQIRMRR